MIGRQIVQRSAAQQKPRTAAALSAEVFGEDDLHIADELAVPQRLEDQVGEAQHRQVLDQLLAQVVINAAHTHRCLSTAVGRYNQQGRTHR